MTEINSNDTVITEDTEAVKKTLPDLQSQPRVPENTFFYNFKQIVLIFLAALATAASVEIFLLPSDVVVGGALGISSILDILLCTDKSKWYFSAGIWTVVVNIPIFCYCFATYRKRFAFKTMLYVVLLGIMLTSLRLLGVSEIFEKLMYGEGEKDKVIYVILGGALHGISLPIMLSVNASTGGTDIVGMIAQKRARQSSSIAMRVIMFTNIILVLASSIVLYFVRGNSADSVNMFIYSVAAMFICEIVQELIFKGFSAALELEITTDKPAEMVCALQSGLRHGTTTVKVQGGFSHTEKSLILCVIKKQQLTHARKIISQVDEHAFAYVENVKEVVGKGFANKEIELDESEEQH